MEIGSLITRAVLTVEESDSFHEAAVWMMERGIGSAVVLKEGKPTGIITDRDALRVIARGTDISKVSVSDCVTRGLKPVMPSMELAEAARMMRDKGFRHLVVVDENGDLYGVFSMRDLVVGLLEERTMAAAANSTG